MLLGGAQAHGSRHELEPTANHRLQRAPTNRPEGAHLLLLPPRDRRPFLERWSRFEMRLAMPFTISVTERQGQRLQVGPKVVDVPRTSWIVRTYVSAL